MKKRLRWLLGILLAAALFVWAFSWGLGIWTIDWDNPAPLWKAMWRKSAISTASWWQT